MIDAVLAKIFGTKHEREMKSLRPVVTAINNLEPSTQALSDEELAGKTVEFRERLAKGETLDDLLPEAFAVVREGGRRILGMRHYDVQLIGGVVLHNGKIAEMKTGEGKTLVATLACYLNALPGKGVHVVTVNDYLARRDSEWMGRLYRFLGLTTGVIVHDLDDEERRNSYAADITYGTNNEFGFDYLRDNMKFRMEDCVQRVFNYAIVDEVDSILIDEARTPLIISGPSEDAPDAYYRVNSIIPRLVRGEVIEGKEPGQKFYTGDYYLEEKHRTVTLTDDGQTKVERLMNMPGLYESADWEGMKIRHHVEQALRAHVMFQRDKDYLVQDGEVVIVDEFTGRIMPGRRWSDGLHQAIEAKEDVKIERENQTLATITFQNYFRMYKKLAGMTGTAETEAAEFYKIYKLDVSAVPTHRPMIRKEFQDVVYRTEEEKFRNAGKFIKELNDKGQPVLVGTISVEKSEKLSRILGKMGVPHEVLNAKNHAREAAIVAQAGRKGAVTVSTNMAGRGTDILLGGNAEFLARDKARRMGVDPDSLPPEQWEQLLREQKVITDKEHNDVVAAGGLCIVGTERHESRRIDNQLRGRAGRQGDPGASRFFLSLQDDLLRIFGGDKIQGLMLRLGMEEDVPIESGLITRRIAGAQKAVETQNFMARKHLLEYDDVMNKQRQAVYTMRRALLEGQEQKSKIFDIVAGIVAQFLDVRAPEKQNESLWDIAGFAADVLNSFGVTVDATALAEMTRVEIEDHVNEVMQRRYNDKESALGSDGPDIMRQTERMVMLNVIDNQWKDHLLSMDHLKEGIGLRGYGQKDPLVEYKKESFTLFQVMMDRIEDETIKFLYFMNVQVEHTGPRGSLVPHPDIMEDDDYLIGNGSENGVATNGVDHGVDHRAAQNAMSDITRNIQRKKEKELAQLQFVGGDSTSTANEPVIAGPKTGRNDPCPCGSGKKFKKCHGA
ncbi:MAG: preprotein translocase subunit SecA [Bryobacteraceae bacterium]|nr:preprotein translocase subunit SecA [Bryobacteraceae bacterium]